MIHIVERLTTAWVEIQLRALRWHNRSEVRSLSQARRSEAELIAWMRSANPPISVPHSSSGYLNRWQHEALLTGASREVQKTGVTR